MIESQAKFNERLDEAAHTRAKAQQLRARAQTLRQKMESLRDEVVLLQQALAQTNSTACKYIRSNKADLHASRSPTYVPNSASSSVVARFIAATCMKDADLDDFTYSLIAAYNNAAWQDDEEAIVLFGNALRQIGHHLVHQLGPKAAGVNLS